jgi:hypothetical protein
MSWGYWGTVTGLVVLVATFFVCLELVYSRPKTSPEASPPKRLSNAVTIYGVIQS